MHTKLLSAQAGETITFRKSQDEYSIRPRWNIIKSLKKCHTNEVLKNNFGCVGVGTVKFTIEF